MLVLIGGADTYVGPTCIEAVERMKAAGSPGVNMIVYPNGQHGWDGVGSRWSNPGGENYSKCVFVQQADRSWVERISGLTTIDANGRSIPEANRQALSACRSHGVSGGPDAEAKEQSLAALKDAMRKAFGLP